MGSGLWRGARGALPAVTSPAAVMALVTSGDSETAPASLRSTVCCVAQCNAHAVRGRGEEARFCCVWHYRQEWKWQRSQLRIACDGAREEFQLPLQLLRAMTLWGMFSSRGSVLCQLQSRRGYGCSGCGADGAHQRPVVMAQWSATDQWRTICSDGCCEVCQCTLLAAATQIKLQCSQFLTWG